MKRAHLSGVPGWLRRTGPFLWITLPSMYLLSQLLQHIVGLPATLVYVHWCEGVRSPRDWIYTHLWTAMWGLGFESGSSGRAVSVHNHWAISPALTATLYGHQCDCFSFAGDDEGGGSGGLWVEDKMEILNSQLVFAEWAVDGVTTCEIQETGAKF